MVTGELILSNPFKYINLETPVQDEREFAHWSTQHTINEPFTWIWVCPLDYTKSYEDVYSIWVKICEDENTKKRPHAWLPKINSQMSSQTKIKAKDLENNQAPHHISNWKLPTKTLQENKTTHSTRCDIQLVQDHGNPCKFSLCFSEIKEDRFTEWTGSNPLGHGCCFGILNGTTTMHTSLQILHLITLQFSVSFFIFSALC